MTTTRKDLFEGFRARPMYDEVRDDSGRLISRTIRRTPRPPVTDELELEPEDRGAYLRPEES